MNRLKRALIFESRRNHFQVLSDILELCRAPQAKTCILRTTNTSFKLLETYLLQLQTSGLLELQAKTRKYLTTLQGQRFIEAWNYLKELIYPQEPLMPQTKKYNLHANQLTTISVKSPRQLGQLRTAK